MSEAHTEKSGANTAHMAFSINSGQDILGEINPKQTKPEG